MMQGMKFDCLLETWYAQQAELDDFLLGQML